MSIKVTTPSVLSAKDAKTRTFYTDRRGRVVYTLYRSNYLVFANNEVNLHNTAIIEFPLTPAPRGLTVAIA